jgi:hypothetical protein
MVLVVVVVVVVVSAAAARAIVSVLYHPHITLAASTDSLLKLFLTEIILHPP